MATTRKFDGKSFQWTNSGSAVSSGDVVTVGVYGLGIATVDIANGATGTVDVSGVHTLAKASGTTAAQGALLFHDGTNVTTTNTDAFLGYAHSALVDGETTCDVLLAPWDSGEGAGA